MLPVYRLSIDPNLEEDKELGIFEIANTATPAIKIKGIAFSDDNTKKIFFADDKKNRIAAPVLTPSKIYRRDPDTEEEYYVEVDTEFIEQAYTDFMAKRMGKQVFNEEHDEGKKSPSYILETWLVEDPKTDKSNTVYGIEVPKGSWFAVQQFTDKEVYEDYVERGLTGFSIHGHSAMMLLSDKNKIKMAKQKDKKTEMSDKPSAFVELPVGEHTIGDTTYTVEEVIENEGTENEWKSNQIVKMVPASGGGEDTEMEEEKKEDKKEEDTEMSEDSEEKKEEDTEMEEDEKKKDESTEMEEDEKKEDDSEMMEDKDKKEEDTEMEEGDGMEYYSKEEVDKKFDELFDMVADLKTQLQNGGEEKEEDTEMNTQMSEQDKQIQLKMQRLEVFKKGVSK